MPSIHTDRAFHNLMLFGGACLMTILGIVLLMPEQTHSRAQTGQRDRLVDTKGSYRSCPIKIIGVESNTPTVTLGKSFLADDDWMKGLNVEIENVSGKVLTHVGIRIDFARPQDQAEEAEGVWDFWYGFNPFWVKRDEDVPPPLVKLIQPNETLWISLTDAEYEILRVFLTNVKYPPAIENIHIFVDTIGFADGTAWRGELVRRDSGAKGGWTPVEIPPGSKLNKRTFSAPVKPIVYKYAHGDAGSTLVDRLTDVNQNGISESAELHTLPEFGIESISLDYREARRRDQYGNEFRYRAKIYGANHTDLGRWAFDVFLLSTHP